MVSIMQYSGVSGYGCTVTNDIDFFLLFRTSYMQFSSYAMRQMFIWSKHQCVLKPFSNI